MNKDKYFIEPNEELQGYDIFKRDGILNPDKTFSHEKILTVYSMEYVQVILYALEHEDSLGTDGFANYIASSPIIEE